MLWGGVIWKILIELVECMTSENILQEHVVPCWPYWIRTIYKARPRVNDIVTNFLSEVQIETLDWPPYGPDLNLTEHT